METRCYGVHCFDLPATLHPTELALFSRAGLRALDSVLDQGGGSRLKSENKLFKLEQVQDQTGTVGWTEQGRDR